MTKAVTSATQRVSETQVQLQVTVTHEALKPHLDRAYREVAKTISIPGFRRGKVPASIIDQRVGKHAVLDRAINNSAANFFQSAVDEQNLTPISHPTARVTSFDPEGTLELVFDVHVYPDVTFPDFDKRQIEVEPVDVTSEMIDAEVMKTREKLATFTPIDKPASDGDFLILDLQLIEDDKVLRESNAVPYELGSNTMFDGLDKSLASATAGYVAILDLPQNEERTQKADQNENLGHAQIKLTVRSVNKRHLPDANDNLANLAGGFVSLEALKQDFAKNLERSLLFQRSLSARDALLDQLLSEIVFPLPAPIADALDKIEDDEEKLKSTRQARRDVMLDLLARFLQVTLTDDELQRYLSSAAAQRRMSVAAFFSAIKNSGQDGYIISDIIRNKALSIALSRVKVVDSNGSPVDISEFTITTDTDPKVRSSE